MSTGTQIEVVMPQMGVSVSEGTITKWLKQPGEPVERDEPLLEISTDKVDTEVPSPGEGVLAEIVDQHRVQVIGEDPPARHLPAVELLRQIRVAAEGGRARLDGLVEGQVLEGVQRVVVHEHRDRALRRQEVGRVVDEVFELVRRSGLAAVRPGSRAAGRGIMHGRVAP